MVAFIGTTGTILGVDLAGEIVQVGKNVTQRKVGERVATFVHGAHYADRGAFAEYVKASADLVWVLPETIAYEQAAAMTCGCIFISSLACLTASSLAVSGWKSRTDDIGERAEYGQHSKPYSTKHDSASLVSLHPMSRQSRETSGSSSTAAAVRPSPDRTLLTNHIYVPSNGPVCYSAPPHAGYKVATTCSSRNFTLVTALGANAVFDYHGPLTEVVRSNKAAAGDTIRSAIDCISRRYSAWRWEGRGPSA